MTWRVHIPWLRNCLAARPVVSGTRAAAALQLLLLLAWHWVILDLCGHVVRIQGNIAQRLWDPQRWGPAQSSQGILDLLALLRIHFQLPGTWTDRLAILFIGMCATLFIAALAFLAMGLAYRRRSPGPAEFIRLCWKAALWGTVILPVGAYVAGGLPRGAAQDFACGVLLTLWLIFAPILVRRAECARGPARWRPCCPECGYSLRGQRSDRCSECGVEFPSTRRAFRRWAFHRLPWDRRSRGFFLVDYLKTVAVIACCPCRAVRGAAVPDNLDRAIRWSVFHILMLVAAYSLLPGRIVRLMNEAELALRGIRATVVREPHEAELLSVFIQWTALAALTWTVVIVVTQLIPIAIAYWPIRRRPSAKLGLTKWALYCSCIPIVMLTVLTLLQVAFVWLTPGRDRPIGTIVQMLHGSVPLLPTESVAAAFGIWWSIGAGGHPFAHRRGLSVVLLNLFLSGGLWLLTWALLFQFSSLRALLW